MSKPHVLRLVSARATQWIEARLVRVGQLLCGLRGHDAVLHFEGTRVQMRCTSCGHDSPGWKTA